MSRQHAPTTAAEFRILKALWRTGSGPVAEVGAKYHELFRERPAYTTVMTLLGRLVAKGLVQVDKSREPYLYSAAVREQSVLGAQLRQFVDHVFDGNAKALVLGLLENESLSAKDLRRIERKLEKGGKR